MKRYPRLLAGAVAVAGLTLGLAACGDDSDTDATTAPAATTAATTAAPASSMATADITVAGAWARKSPSMTDAGAAYLTLTSKAGDKLVSGTADGVAKMVEIHETTTDASGAMSMKPLEGGLALPAGTAVAMKPGGYHIMLMGLVKPLEVGTTISIALTFEKAGMMKVDFPVMENAPDGSGDMAGMGTETTMAGMGTETTMAGMGTETTMGAMGAAVTVDKAWARTSPAMTNAGAAYAVLMSKEGDKLVSAKADGVAKMVQVHETTKDASGAMGMQEMPNGLELPAGQMVELKPGGYHIMLMELVKPLTTGDTITITLTFEKAGSQDVSFPVRDDAP